MKELKKIFGLISLCLCFWVGSKIDWNREKIDGCPFCNNKILERQAVHRGTYASVITTHKPAVPGHQLIIPNRHAETIDQLTSQEIEEIGEWVKKIHTQYQNEYHTSDYVLIQKNGPAAGQTVPHMHIHILPRSKEMSTTEFALRFLVAPWLKPSNVGCVPRD
jgi:diadenosine tetraphosphate (Ap4A) HIT family hydrolase